MTYDFLFLEAVDFLSSRPDWKSVRRPGITYLPINLPGLGFAITMESIRY